MHIKDHREKIIQHFTACLDNCIANESAQRDAPGEVKASRLDLNIRFEMTREDKSFVIASHPTFDLDQADLGEPNMKALLIKSTATEPHHTRVIKNGTWRKTVGREVSDIRKVTTNLWRVGTRESLTSAVEWQAWITTRQAAINHASLVYSELHQAAGHTFPEVWVEFDGIEGERFQVEIEP